jgi:hypothetical protein
LGLTAVSEDVATIIMNIANRPLRKAAVLSMMQSLGGLICGKETTHLLAQSGRDQAHAPFA